MASGESRRDFLKIAAGLWGALCAVPLAGMIIQYITPAAARSLAPVSILVGKTTDFAEGTVKIVRADRDPVLLIHSRTGQFRALSARCTHLGCVVQYQEAPEPHFSCNCHGSQFDFNGVNVAGPAPKPLPPYRVTVEGISLYVTKA